MCLIRYGLYPFIKTNFASFDELFEHTRDILYVYKGMERVTVFGPVTSADKLEMQANINFLQKATEDVAKVPNRVALDLMSIRPIWLQLLGNVKNTYPKQILYKYTIPLIQSLLFEKVFFLRDYQQSFGTKLEFKASQEIPIPWEYYSCTGL